VFPVLDFRQFDVITFDCYGTLIDWERGMLDALRPVRDRAGRSISDRELLEAYATLESRHETGHYHRYRDVLREVMRELVQILEVPPRHVDLEALANSLPGWPPFPDTVESLRRLKQHKQLAIISNTDRDLFAGTAPNLQVPFDWVITAEDVGSYKPSHKNFEHALDTMGIAKERVLHAAQSRFHDIAPARALGIACVWVNRRHGKDGEGATAPSLAEPDFEVHDLKSLADLVEARA
jgi:2-haloacid dehalogenase